MPCYSKKTGKKVSCARKYGAMKSSRGGGLRAARKGRGSCACAPKGTRAVKGKTLDTYAWEYTDTFGGEANYSWVNRGQVRASSLLGAVRLAKAAAGLSGTKGRSSNYGDQYDFRPYGRATVLFVNWADG